MGRGCNGSWQPLLASATPPGSSAVLMEEDEEEEEEEGGGQFQPCTWPWEGVRLENDSGGGSICPVRKANGRRMRKPKVSPSLLFCCLPLTRAYMQPSACASACCSSPQAVIFHQQGHPLKELAPGNHRPLHATARWPLVGSHRRAMQKACTLGLLSRHI